MAGALPRNNGNRSANRVGATVSRRLRAADWNVCPSARKHKYDGMYVSGRDGLVTVLIDYGIDAKNQRIARGVTKTVGRWAEAGEVEATVLEDGAVMLHFTYGR